MRYGNGYAPDGHDSQREPVAPRSVGPRSVRRPPDPTRVRAATASRPPPSAGLRSVGPRCPRRVAYPAASSEPEPVYGAPYGDAATALAPVDPYARPMPMAMPASPPLPGRAPVSPGRGVGRAQVRPISPSGPPPPMGGAAVPVAVAADPVAGRRCRVRPAGRARTVRTALAVPAVREARWSWWAARSGWAGWPATTVQWLRRQPRRARPQGARPRGGDGRKSPRVGQSRSSAQHHRGCRRGLRHAHRDRLRRRHLLRRQRRDEQRAHLPGDHVDLLLGRHPAGEARREDPLPGAHSTK